MSYRQRNRSGYGLHTHSNSSTITLAMPALLRLCIAHLLNPNSCRRGMQPFAVVELFTLILCAVASPVPPATVVGL